MELFHTVWSLSCFRWFAWVSGCTTGAACSFTGSMCHWKTLCSIIRNRYLACTIEIIVQNKLVRIPQCWVGGLVVLFFFKKGRRVDDKNERHRNKIGSHWRNVLKAVFKPDLWYSKTHVKAKFCCKRGKQGKTSVPSTLFLSFHLFLTPHRKWHWTISTCIS